MEQAIHQDNETTAESRGATYVHFIIALNFLIKYIIKCRPFSTFAQKGGGGVKNAHAFLYVRTCLKCAHEGRGQDFSDFCIHMKW